MAQPQAVTLGAICQQALQLTARSGHTWIEEDCGMLSDRNPLLMRLGNRDLAPQPSERGSEKGLGMLVDSLGLSDVGTW